MEPGGPAPYRSKTRYLAKEVAQQYDADRFRSPVGRFVDRLEKRGLGRALAHLPQNATILEVACGTGRITKLLAERGFRVYGLDYSPAMILRAVERLRGNPAIRGFLRGEAESIPVDSKSVDAVVAFRFATHLPPKSRGLFLREVARVARKHAVISYQSKCSLHYVYRRVRSRFVDEPFPFAVSREDILTEAESAGLVFRKSYPILFPLAETYVVVYDVPAD